MFNDYNELITIEELCSVLSIGKNAAYALLNSNEIKAFKIGRNWKIPKRSVEAFIIQKSGLIYKK